jgi:hypothetical protein
MTLPAKFIEAREKYNARANLTSMLVHWRYREQHPDSDRKDFFLTREYMAAEFGEAVALKDSTIFRDVAEILDALPDGDYEHVNHEKLAAANSDYNVVRFVIDARTFLEAEMLLERAPQRKLTKSEVKQVAQRLWAGNRLVARGKLKRSSNEVSEDAENLIQAEIEGYFPTVDWTKMWGKAGCDDLESAPAGRPPKKKKKR